MANAIENLGLKHGDFGKLIGETLPSYMELAVLLAKYGEEDSVCLREQVEVT